MIKILFLLYICFMISASMIHADPIVITPDIIKQNQIQIQNDQIEVRRLNNQIDYFQSQINEGTIKISIIKDQINTLQNQIDTTLKL